MFQIARSEARYGIVIDIGSGSVGAALVESSDVPHILWSVREFIPHAQENNYTKIMNSIIRALKNVFYSCSTAGIQALKAHSTKAQVTYIQVSISAPWSYTLTKKTRVVSQKKFEFTESVLKNLERKIKKEIDADLESLAKRAEQELTVASHQTIQISSGGYALADPIGAQLSDVELLQLFSIADAQLMDAITEHSERTFPNAELNAYSFMSIFYTALQNLPIDSSELCLADISHEAVEFGIVRHGVLVHTTHVPSGIRCLTAAIAQTCNVPVPEAHGFLRANHRSALGSQSHALEEIFAQFETDIQNELQSDLLSQRIPKTIVFYSNDRAETFLLERIAKSVRQTGRAGQLLHMTVPHTRTAAVHDDSALLLSAFVLQKHY